MGLLAAPLLPPASASILQTSEVVQALGSLVGEAGEAKPHNSVGLFFPCGSIELTLLWFMELTSPPLASHIFFLTCRRGCFQAPRCCPWEPNNYGTVGSAPQRAQASRDQQRGWEGWWLITSVLGSETSLTMRPILVSERLQCGSGHRS